MRAIWAVMTCACACNVPYLERVKREGSSWPLEWAASLLSRSSLPTSLGTISSTLFLNQNISRHPMRHFGSRHLDPVLFAPGGVMAQVSVNLWKGWHKRHNSVCHTWIHRILLKVSHKNVQRSWHWTQEMFLCRYLYAIYYRGMLKCICWRSTTWR